VDSEERESRVGHGINEVAHEMLRGWSEYVVFASEGNDLHAGIDAAQAGHAIALQPGAIDQAACPHFAERRAENEFARVALAVEADVSREADCVRLIQEAVAKFGPIHILINNAGIGGGNLVAETKTEDFDRVLKTNLYGTFWCARAAYPQMKRNEGDPRGVIINISSLAGKQSWSGTGT
jgi:NAD(P)-dependent dehydrogenase (short-subunit alcohol dehydrogenase family)